MAPQRSRTWDILMMVLLTGSVAIVFWYESTSRHEVRRAIEWVDLALVLFFLGEWLWRVQRSRPTAGRYALRTSWELLGMVPLILPGPSLLRLLRLLRLFRILRVFGTLGRQFGLWERVARQAHLKPIVLVAAGITIVGALAVWGLERDADDANITSFGQAVWWATVTVTTVGYGDAYPVTVAGRFVAALLMMTGIGMIGLLASSLASAFIQPGAAAPTPLPVPGRDLVVEDLARLAEMHRAGALSETEFAAAKARLLR